MTKHKKHILNRMHYVSGHINGVAKMIENDKYCIDIIQQNQAVCAALEKINKLILENHLNTCVASAIQGNDVKKRQTKIKEIVEIFNKNKK